MFMLPSGVGALKEHLVVSLAPLQPLDTQNNGPLGHHI